MLGYIQYFTLRLFVIAFGVLGTLSVTVAQQIRISGNVKDVTGNTIPDCQVGVKALNKYTRTDINGSFEFNLVATKSITLTFQHVGYLIRTETIKLNPDKRTYQLSIELAEKPTETGEVEVLSKEKHRDKVSTTEINTRDVKTLPSTFGDFNMILATLPGVISNNELSSQYSVRGGNFDENLVYVNDIEIYRPFLVRAGQQEGLSFVNPDLVKNVEFSSGGWQPRFGDKLSSVLNVEYKTPNKFGGTITAGILNQAFSLEGANFNKRLTWVESLVNTCFLRTF